MFAGITDAIDPQELIRTLGTIGLILIIFAESGLLLGIIFPGDSLLFTAGLMIDVRRLFDEVSAVLLLAVVAVLVCIAGVAAVVHLATGADMIVCLLLGTIVSTTDPAAVMAWRHSVSCRSPAANTPSTLFFAPSCTTT